MSKVAIVTDSTAYIPPELVSQYNLHVAPQVLIWGNEILRDGVDIQPEEFYTRLKTAKELATTSQVNPKSFYDIYKSLQEQDYEILTIVLSSHFSKTIESAEQAKEMVPNATIEIVDSKTTAMAMGFLVLAAARALADGASLLEAKALAEKARDHVGIVLAVETLEYLHRGGRIGGGARFLGTALNLKPILEVTGGRIEAVERVRTRSKSLARVAELIEERVGGRTPVRLATLHANSPTMPWHC
jgi:DegV family protein with EDD domain